MRPSLPLNGAGHDIENVLILFYDVSPLLSLEAGGMPRRQRDGHDPPSVCVSMDTDDMCMPSLKFPQYLNRSEMEKHEYYQGPG